MSSNPNSSFAAEDRPLALRKRPDLVIEEVVYQLEKCWVIKDPISLKYYRLLEPEFRILEMLDGQTSYRQIKAEIDTNFPERITKFDSLQNLISSLHKSGLLLADSEEQAEPLIKRFRKERRQKLTQLFSNVLAIRFPGIDPERLLAWLYPKIKWMFSGWFTAICFGLMAVAALLVLQNLHEFYTRLPEFERFFSAQNIALMAIVLGVTKIFHELGHGIFCKHYGGECHEIGFMLLVLTPAMYCNTSDSWMLGNRWHRAAVGAAGIYVELVLSAICTLVWWNTNPGWIHYICLNVMFLSSISTVLFNGNPLLRYDGYYILSDILEIPNLSQKSRTVLLSKLREWCLGMEPVNQRLLPKRNQWMFAVYSVASFCYRWFVLIMILYFLSQVFEPWGLAVVGQMLIGISLIGLIVMPFYKLGKFFSYPGRMRQVKRPRFIASTVVVVILLGLIALLPVPQKISAPVVVQPDSAKVVYVNVPGNVVEILAHPGESVKKGDPIARLENYSVSLAHERVKSEVQKYEKELLALESNPTKWATRILATKKQLDDARLRCELRQSELEKLTLKAPQDGTIIQSQYRTAQPSPEQTLVQWSGFATDEENLGAYLEPQTPYCLVGDATSYKATLVVEESVVALLEPDQTVQIMLDEYPGQVFKATVESVSKNKMQTVPRQLSQNNGGSLATKPDSMGGEKTLFISYNVNVPLSRDELSQQKMVLSPGFRGQAKIKVGSASIGSQLIRYLRTVIHFR